jgi:hypothetical protein
MLICGFNCIWFIWFEFAYPSLFFSSITWFKLHMNTRSLAFLLYCSKHLKWENIYNTYMHQMVIIVMSSILRWKIASLTFRSKSKVLKMSPGILASLKFNPYTHVKKYHSWNFCMIHRNFRWTLFWNKWLSILKFPIIFVAMLPKFFHIHTFNNQVLQRFLGFIIIKTIIKFLHYGLRIFAGFVNNGIMLLWIIWWILKKRGSVRRRL